MVEVLFKSGAVEIVDLVNYISLDPPASCLVVQHLGEDVQLSVGQLWLRRFDEEELGETEGWDYIRNPL